MWMNWTRPGATKKLAKVTYNLDILFSTLALFSKIFFTSLKIFTPKLRHQGTIYRLRKELFWPYGLTHIFSRVF